MNDHEFVIQRLEKMLDAIEIEGIVLQLNVGGGPSKLKEECANNIKDAIEDCADDIEEFLE